MKKCALLRGLLVVLLTAPLFSQQAFLATNFSAAGNNGGIKQIGTGIAFVGATWTKSGTVTVCSFKMDSSVDGITWNNGDVLGATSCAANGQSAYTNTVYNYVRARVTSFTGTGTVNIAQIGYINNPVPTAATTPAAPDTSVQFNDGGVFGGDAGLTWGKTAKRFTAGTAVADLNADVANNLGSPTILLSSKNNIDPNLGVPNLIVAQSDGSDIGASGTIIGSYSLGLFTSTNNAGGFVSGLQSEGWTSTDSTKDVAILVGAAFGTLHGGAGTVSDAYGIEVFSNAKNGSGTITNSTAITIDSNISVPGVTTGLFIDDQEGGSTGSYGIHLATQGAGANDYAIKVDGGKSDLGPQSTKVGSLLTNTNCAAVGSAADPSVAACTAAAAGTVSCATSLTNTCTITSTAILTSSEVFIHQNTSANAGTKLGITCNTTPSTLNPLVVSQGAGTVTFSVTKPNVNPACFDYFVVN